MICQLCEWKHIEIIEGNVQLDHIHLVLSVAPEYSISGAVCFLKGKDAVRVFDMYLEREKRYRGRHCWTRKYFVNTVGLNEDKVRKYVRRQREKDECMDQL